MIIKELRIYCEVYEQALDVKDYVTRAMNQIEIQASAGWRHTDTLIEVGRLDMPHIHTSRVYSTEGFSPTICASEPPKIEEGELKIRRLTPRECWRLMGFTDKDFDKAQEGMSVSRLYILAGNSIVVDVLEAIFAALYIDETYYEIKDLTKF